MKPTLAQRAEFYALRGLLRVSAFSAGRRHVASAVALESRATDRSASEKASLRSRSPLLSRKIAAGSRAHRTRFVRSSRPDRHRDCTSPEARSKGAVLDVWWTAWRVGASWSTPLAAGKGIVFVGGHHGNWELIGAYPSPRAECRSTQSPRSGKPAVRRVRERRTHSPRHDDRARFGGGDTNPARPSRRAGGSFHCRSGSARARLDLCDVLWPARKDSARRRGIRLAIQRAGAVPGWAAPAEWQVPDYHRAGGSGAHRRQGGRRRWDCHTFHRSCSRNG